MNDRDRLRVPLAGTSAPCGDSEESSPPLDELAEQVVLHRQRVESLRRALDAYDRAYQHDMLMLHADRCGLNVRHEARSRQPCTTLRDLALVLPYFTE